MIRQKTHLAIVSELRERIVFLEAELARTHSENRDLVNAMATQVRAPQPFKVPIAIGEKLKVRVAGRKSVFMRERELEAATRSIES